jgi:hypothetical protein
MLSQCLNPGADTTLTRVLQLSAFGFLSLIVRRGWASIDGGAENLSPGKAQGFLWIPFFNFYWVFPAFVSLATQTNAKAAAENIPQGRITRGFGLVIAILFSVTTLTELLISRYAPLCWLHFILYATYVGFAVTYVWQLRRSAEAFDERSAPAVREPAKMPTVGVAGIIYGCACAALLCLTLAESLALSPEIIEKRLQAKGYTVTYEDVGDNDATRLMMKGIVHTDDMKGLVVQKNGQVVGFVIFASVLSEDAAERVAEKYATKALKVGSKVLFRAQLNGPPLKKDVPIEEWLASF